MLVFAILLIIAGIVSAVAPSLIFDITQSWKYSQNTSPSDLYKIITRVQGGILIIVGIVLICSPD